MSNHSDIRILWEYEIHEKFRDHFVKAYEPQGVWAKLFSRYKGHVKTELIRDMDQPNRFITIDYWQSYSAFSIMKHTISDEYDELDRQCDAYTLSEKYIGCFQCE